MFVYLNPGHDMFRDPGAVNDHLALTEAQLARDLAWLISKRLDQHRIRNIVEQNDDLFGVICNANRWQADLFVSIHFNAFNRHATGTETFVSYTPHSVMAGHAIQQNVCAALELPDRGIKENMNLLVINSTSMPAVLVEVCFIDNDDDIRRYEERKGRTADAIATGIIQYMGQVEGKAA